MRSSVLIGFIGAYTTFSSLSLETYRLLQGGAIALAVANSAGSLAAGLAVVYGWRRVGQVDLDAHGGRRQAPAHVHPRDRPLARGALYGSDRRAGPGRGPDGCHGSQGVEGFGAVSRLHSSRILRRSEDLPIVIEMVDTAENIDRVLPQLDEMVTEGMLTVERVHIIAYRGSAKG